MIDISPAEAAKLILAGESKSGWTLDGKLSLAGSGKKLKKLPAKLTCYELDASNSDLETVPADLAVDCALNLQGCRKLKSLPADLRVGTLNVAECTALEELPEGLDVWFLNISGCPQLTSFPRRATIARGNLNMNGCTGIAEIPNYVQDLGTLDIGNCPQITEVPAGLSVSSWIELAGSGVTSLPERLNGIGLRWRGVLIDEVIAFHPEKLTSKIVLKERNAERRRVMIERMGFDRFIRDAGAEKLDADRDPGGPRELLRVPMERDEAIVCLSCNCPSTARHYLLRVPPTMTTCHQAAAWMAGFDDPKLYNPLQET
ncbi:DUF6745 domain-containing protein [Anatilimnocola floriformis]|uniref:DUF6745 domain-containing protein n=1 Tax=Anatilimnocola floriformis TaxID=2948575 RepID=UPI0028F4298A|nr:hypothetical protein [Anatilimnocola floriformis]